MFRLRLNFGKRLETGDWRLESHQSRNQRLQISNLLFALLLAFLLLHMSLAVFAHSDLVRATPAAGSTVASNLPGIQLVFSEPVTNDSTILLFGNGFDMIP